MPGCARTTWPAWASLWLVVSLLAEETVTIMAHPAYHEAYRVVPWIAGAFLFQGLGTVWNISMFVHRITKYRLMTSIVDGDGEPRPELPAHPALRHDGRRGGRPRKLRVPVRHPGQDRLSPVPGAPRMGTDLSASWAWVAESMRSAASSTWGSIPTALAGKGLLILAAPALLFATGFFERGGDHAAQDPGRGLPAERHRSGRGGRREMTRILFLIDELDVGGTEQQLLELVKRLDRQRYEPVVCCFRPGRSPRRSRPRASGSSRSKARQGRSRLRREARPDDAAGADRPAADLPLHREHLGTTGRTPRRGPDHRDAPSGTSTCGKSGTSSGSASGSTGGRSGPSATPRRSETISPPRALRAKLRVIYNGVDTSRFEGPLTPHAAREEFGIPQHHAVVGHLARLEPQKDPRTFLAAAAIVARKMPSVSFLVVGGKPSGRAGARRRTRWDSAAASCSPGRGATLPRLLAACDMSVLSSVKEGMSNTIMESMAAGKPMVATRVGGNPELMQDGETGFLVSPRDPTALADAIQRILDDPALAKSMGLHAKARMAERFSVDAMVAATQGLYDELVAAAATGCRAASAKRRGRRSRERSRSWRPSSPQCRRLLPPRGGWTRGPRHPVPDLLAALASTAR